MIESGETKEDLAASLARDFEAEGVSPSFATEMAQQLIAEYATFEVQPPEPGTIGLMVGRYAIRKDDVKLFDAVMDGLKAAAGVSFFTAHQPTLTANVAIGISVAKLIRTAVMRGAMLDRDAVRVLTILRCNARSPKDSGLTAAEILTVVQRSNPGADLTWVQQKLDYLKEVPTRDGGTAKLASMDSFGRWRSHA